MFKKSAVAIIALLTLATLWYFGYLGRSGGGIENGPESSQQVAIFCLGFLCFSGAAISTKLGKMPWEASGTSATRIILRDYKFDKYATIVLISHAYSLIQGVCIGGFFGGFAYWMITDGSNVRLGPEGALLPLSFAVTLVAARIILEGLVLIYKAAQDISDYTRKDRG